MEGCETATNATNVLPPASGLKKTTGSATGPAQAVLAETSTLAFPIQSSPAHVTDCGNCARSCTLSVIRTSTAH